MVRVVERQVALVAEVVLLERERREPGDVLEAPAAVARDPRPRHAARERRRVEIRSDCELPVFLVRGREDVAVVVDVDRGLVAVPERGRHLHGRAELSAASSRSGRRDKTATDDHRRRDDEQLPDHLSSFGLGTGAMPAA